MRVGQNGELVRGRVAVKSVFAHQVGQVVRSRSTPRPTEIKAPSPYQGARGQRLYEHGDRRPSLIGDLTPGAPAAPGGFGSATGSRPI